MTETRNKLTDYASLLLPKNQRILLFCTHIDLPQFALNDTFIMARARNQQLHVNEFKLDFELPDLQPEEIIQGFRAARAIPVKTLVEGFLNQDEEKTNLFFARNYRRALTEVSLAELSEWAQINLSNVILDKLTCRQLVLSGLIHKFGCKDVTPTYQHGPGPSERYFKLAADRGDAMGMFFLGAFLFHFPSTLDEAKLYFQKAFEKGFVTAVSECYVDDLSLVSYLWAAKKGESTALHRLGLEFLNGSSAIKKDLLTASKLFASSALKGNARGIAMYRFLQKDDEQWKFCRLALEGGDAIVQSELRTIVLCQLQHNDIERMAAPIYHITLSLNKFSLHSNKTQTLRSCFTQLYFAYPEKIDNLSRELGDSLDEVTAIFATEEEKTCLVATPNWSQIWLEKMWLELVSYYEIHHLPLVLLKIVSEYTTYLMPFFLEREMTAKKQFLVNHSDRFFKLNQSAENGKITFQQALRTAEEAIEQGSRRAILKCGNHIL